MRILLLHGPNLSQLGSRDPAQYGVVTEDDLTAIVGDTSPAVIVERFSNDSEADIVRRVHAARSDGTQGVIINPGALTHYSWSLRDALDLLTVPVVEVHLSQTHARETFRHHSVVSGVATATITGAGALGYRLATLALLDLGR